MPGSGKTEAINYLIKKLGWPKVYLGNATFEEMARRKMAINEKNERLIREFYLKEARRLLSEMTEENAKRFLELKIKEYE